MRKVTSSVVCFLLLSLLIAYTASGQVSTYRSIETIRKKAYNYPPEAEKIPQQKKSEELRIVYSDRAKNKAFSTPYAQRVIDEQEMGRAYYVVGEKNGHYELVIADPKSVGKPKGLFSFLYSRENHFKDSKSLTYIGWIPKSKLLGYNHAFVSPQNHRPLRYSVGISSIHRLYDLHRHLKGDSLSVYADPSLKQALTEKIVVGSLVYAYKYDESKRAVLVSDKATLETKGRKVLGWIPADMIAYAGQHHTFYFPEDGKSYSWREALVDQTGASPDSITFSTQDLPTKFLFTTDRRSAPTSDNDSTQQVQWALSLALAVWDHSKNKIINVEGEDIATTEVQRMARGQKHLNIHLVYFEQEQTEVKRLINALQNIALKVSPSKSYTYSALIISQLGNRFFPPTANFASWLDFLLNIRIDREESSKGLEQGLQKLSQALTPTSFEDNLIFLLGSNQDISLSSELLSKLAERNVSIALLQLRNQSGEEYQDFILEGKEMLDEYILRNNNYLSRYIVSPTLLKPSIFLDYGTDASIYLLDVPKESTAVGGIVFPYSDENLSNVAVETTIDTLLKHLDIRNELLLSSLREYESKLGVLRSEPSQVLAQLHQLSPQSGLELKDIDRNSTRDVFHSSVWMPQHLLVEAKEAYIFSREEMTELLDNYRTLLPSFLEGIGKTELKELRRQYKQERQQINASRYIKLLKRRDKIANLFYHKTGIWPNASLLYDLRPCDLKYKRVSLSDWELSYRDLLTKVDRLEEAFVNERLEQKKLGEQSYYVLPKALLP